MDKVWNWLKNQKFELECRIQRHQNMQSKFEAVVRDNSSCLNDFEDGIRIIASREVNRYAALRNKAESDLVNVERAMQRLS